MCDQREAFPAGPEVTTWQGPGNPAPVSGSCWAQVLASPWTPAQRQPAAGRSRGVRGRGGADAEASGSQGCEGPSGGRASGAAPLTSRAAGPATGCTGCTGCRGSASMGSGCSATDCKTEAGGDPAATRRDPRWLPGAAPRGSGLGTHSSVSAGISNFSLRDFMAAPREPTPGGTGREQTRGDYGLRDVRTGVCRGRGHRSRGRVRGGTAGGLRGGTTGGTETLTGRTKAPPSWQGWGYSCGWAYGLEAGSWEGLWVPSRARLLGVVVWEWGGTSVV